MRKKRKREHVENYLKTSFQGDTLFGDVFLEHNSLPELNFSEIDTKTTFLGKTIDYPILINAMTGGTEFSEGINRELSLLAKEFNIAMAVGSETIALCEEEGCRKSFEIVRETIGQNGLVFANLSAAASLEEVKAALNLIHGDAIQLHVNVAQELAMEEGDRDFSGIYENIRNILENIDKPVIVKEVGFGISKNVAQKLYEIGVRYVDISGHGGTNFIEIENLRNMNIDLSELYSWGIPTALSLIKCRELSSDLKIVSSGGIKSSKDIVKSLVLGADIVGISGELLSYLIHGGYDNAKNYLDGLAYKIKMIMMLMGKKNIEELKTADYKIIGDLKDLI
ncbi:type 2 isopentenyl-diphosphate Delta-isomerase [Tissierella creatinophila]|uniref:Isopentenyl-diphosphate delta-isomerase n=1 Tax=Tissierella creatinophila DSM 6911 TaxID=1123403 RepID=A0A1U7M8T1_TISCR|nr:type 2 isopentenyl-diphosphate Delta-isomerase [Tissierella creatinophila]OLS03707.1 isopentenyl-diphosphate delta-isomerase [Tissierella creatinophila DSM 6911]